MRWRGGNGTASPLIYLDAKGLSDWKPILENLQDGTVVNTSPSKLADELSDLGEGSSALVTVRWKGQDFGHAFNAVNDGGVIRWIDGQENVVGGWPPAYADHATDWMAVIVDSTGNPVGG